MELTDRLLLRQLPAEINFPIGGHRHILRQELSYFEEGAPLIWMQTMKNLFRAFAAFLSNTLPGLDSWLSMDFYPHPTKIGSY